MNELADRLEDFMRRYRLQYTMKDDDEHLSLVDALSAPDDLTVGTGLKEIRLLCEELAELRASPWVRVEDDEPPSCEPVLAYYETAHGKGRRIRAIRADRFSLKADFGSFSEDWGEYCEEEDEYYAKEGWYEWNEAEEAHYAVPEPVTHWMPLPASPLDTA